MNTFIRLFEQQPIVFVHLVGALAAIALGAVLLWGRKGSTAHRTLGWAWVLAMGTAAASSVFIHSEFKLSIAGFSPIHLLTVLVLVQLPMGVYYARQGRIAAHRKMMRGLYLGACVVAGLFTLLPGRFLGQLVWPALGSLAA